MKHSKTIQIVFLVCVLPCLTMCPRECNDREIEYTPVNLHLNVKSCGSPDIYADNGFNSIIWEGTLLEAVDGAVPGRDNFEYRSPRLTNPDEAPDGGSIFSTLEEGLTAGSWHINVQAHRGGSSPPYGADETIEIHYNGHINFNIATEEMTYNSIATFPDCP